MAKIYVKFNSAIIKEVTLEKDITTFGRKPDNDIVIDNPAISGFHGKILKVDEQYFIEDLNSTNGTYINGERIKRSLLKNRDQISIARHVIEFITDAFEPTLAEKLSELSEKNEQRPPKVEEVPSVKPPANLMTKETPTPPSVVVPLEPSKLTPTPPPPSVEAPTLQKVPVLGHLKILYGGEGQSDINLKDIVTYIGSADQAAIKLKGLMAPSIAVAISRRSEGFFLKAVKAGYVKVNGKTVQDQVFLEHGAQIELGGMTLIFQDLNHKKKTP